LRELPSFTGIMYPLDEEALRGMLVIAPSLMQLEKAFDRAKYGDVSNQPYLEVSIPSLADATLAPVGQHVMSIWLQYAPYRSNADSQQVCELVLARLSDYAPNLRSLVLHAQVVTPRDFETRFYLSEGHLY